jgi:hypothetical protein
MAHGKIARELVIDSSVTIVAIRGWLPTGTQPHNE